MKNSRFLPLVFLTAALMVLGIDQLVLHGIYAWAASTPEYGQMVAELAAVYVLLAFSLYKLEGAKWKLAAVGLISSLFFWCHVVFLPMAAAGLYLAYICGIGGLLRRYVFCLAVPKGEGYGADFLLGASAVIVLFCLLSAAGIGAIPVLQLIVAASGAAMLLFFGRGQLGRLRSAREDAADAKGRAAEDTGWTSPYRFLEGPYAYKWTGLLLAFILLMFLLQAGRMDISVDHDTLWYSVRSEYMLDNGPRGIYENMGTVSLVYTYPKGWEVLTLPLCDLPSHSFLLAFNLWVTALVVYTAYRIARQYMEEPYASLVPFLLSGIPGIMNMGISGKTDNITLLLQLLMILYMLYFIKDGRGTALALSLGTLFLSWTMKPTAVVFSTAVFGSSVLYLMAMWLAARRREGMAAGRTACLAGKATRLKAGWSQQLAAGRSAEGWTERLAAGRSEGRRSWRVWLAMCLPGTALALIWYRTYLFVGVPVTSIFSGIFQKLGCKIRYPFLVWDIPDYGAKPTMEEALLQLAKRLYGVFILPKAQDMSRVLISWCSLSVVFFGLLWLSSLPGRGRAGRGRDPAEGTCPWRLIGYGRLLLLVLGLASTYSIYSLKQVDGNYFILFYTLTVLYGCRVIAVLGRRAEGLGLQKRFRRQIGTLLLLLTLFDSVMVSLSDLAWSVGLTPIAWSHSGYLDHEEEARKAMEETGNGQIWQILAADPQNRAIAFGEHLAVLSFPCNVQSYTDISSSSGNEQLVEDVEAFKTYMAYAKTDYVYVEAGYMAESYLGFGLLRDCIRAGILTNIRDEQGNILADVDLEGEPGADADAQLETFDRCYIVKGD